MLHVFLAVSVLCLAVGVAVVILSSLACIRFSSIAFRSLAAVVGASLLMMIVDLLKQYHRAVPGGVADGLLPLYVALSAAGFGIFAYEVPALIFRVVGRGMTGSHRAAAALLAGLLLVAGAWVEWRPGALSATAVAVGMIAVHAYGLTVLGTSLSSIENSHVRRLARSFLWIVPPLMLVIVAQNAAVALGWAPAVLREFPVAQLLYLLVTECLLLVYGLLYLFKQEPASACTLPDPFVQNYSISPRECEIISMIVQGYGNRMIGEKLYISAMTVKNHIYHIYQKTSAGNKVQLINLINSLK